MFGIYIYTFIIFYNYMLHVVVVEVNNGSVWMIGFCDWLSRTPGISRITFPNGLRTWRDCHLGPEGVPSH